MLSMMLQDRSHPRQRSGIHRWDKQIFSFHKRRDKCLYYIHLLCHLVETRLPFNRTKEKESGALHHRLAAGIDNNQSHWQ